MYKTAELLVIGAGPFGLAIASYAIESGINTIVVGKSMEFWKNNMPKGMFLRSDTDSHLDVVNLCTIEKYMAIKGKSLGPQEPISRDLYIEYCEWFQEEKGIFPIPVHVKTLRRENQKFVAELEDGQIIIGKNVVIAVGLSYFAHIPAELLEKFPRGFCKHSANLVDFEVLKNKRVLIVGGRQSAFEWAALIRESGAASVDLVYGHDSPIFFAADSSWMQEYLESDSLNWYRDLSDDHKKIVDYRAWSESRLNLEPWLESRILKPGIALHPNSKIISSKQIFNEMCSVELSDGFSITVDRIILATGYRINVKSIPFLQRTALGEQILIHFNNYPILDAHLQTNIPRLFMTGMLAKENYGSFFEFTIAARLSAKIICAKVLSG